jgi:hypothetical protein
VHSGVPLVQSDVLANGGPLPPGSVDPPGVNLRVGYLAWAGWNHEDACVLSQSAAAKLRKSVERRHVIALTACETDAAPLVGVGDKVRREHLLIQRKVAAASFWLGLKKIHRLQEAFQSTGDLQDIVLTPCEEDHAKCDGRFSRSKPGIFFADRGN